MQKRPDSWTEEEDAVIRRLYPKIHAVKPTARARLKKELKKLLPNRSERSIAIRAWKMGITNSYYWTPEEEAILTEYWPDGGVRTLREQLPKRNWAGMRAHAKRMGLPERWQGYLTVAAAAKRLGYDRDTVLAALKAASVTTYMRGGKKTASTPKYRHRVVEWDEAQDAMLSWMARGRPIDAAKEAGVPYRTLLDWLKASGVYTPCKGHPIRIDEEQMAAIIAKHKPAWEKRCRAATERRRKGDKSQSEVTQGRPTIHLGKDQEKSPEVDRRGEERGASSKASPDGEPKNRRVRRLPGARDVHADGGLRGLVE